MKSLMVDIETLSSRHDAAIVAIGAVVFDAEAIIDTQEILIDPVWAVGHRSPVTYKDFWMDREKVPQRMYDHLMSGVLMPWEACEIFTSFVKDYKISQCWANPPQFDIVLLRSLFDEYHAPFPIHYRDERDCRTIWHLAKNMGIEDRLKATRRGLNKHMPVDDAIAQARAVQIINQVIV